MAEDTLAKSICEDSPYVKYFGEKQRQFLIGNEPFDPSKDYSIGLSPGSKFTGILLPGYMPEIYKLATSSDANKMMYSFLKFVAQAATTVEFHQAITLGVSTPEMKNTFTKIFSTGRQEGGPEELTLNIPYELRNFFLTKTLKHWLGALADPYSLAAHYNDTGIAFNMWSSGCGFRYLKPDQGYQVLETSALLANCIPKGYDASVFNADSASAEVMPITLTMTCSVLDDSFKTIKEENEKTFDSYKDYAAIASFMFGTTKGTLTAYKDFETDVKDIYGN